MQVLDANKTVDELHAAIRTIATEIIQVADGTEIGQLWSSPVSAEEDNIPRKKHCNGGGDGLKQGVDGLSTPLYEKDR